MSHYGVARSVLFLYHLVSKGRQYWQRNCRLCEGKLKRQRREKKTRKKRPASMSHSCSVAQLVFFSFAIMPIGQISKAKAAAETAGRRRRWGAMHRHYGQIPRATSRRSRGRYGRATSTGRASTRWHFRYQLLVVPSAHWHSRQRARVVGCYRCFQARWSSLRSGQAKQAARATAFSTFTSLFATSVFTTSTVASVFATSTLAGLFNGSFAGSFGEVGKVRAAILGSPSVATAVATVAQSPPSAPAKKLPGDIAQEDRRRK